MTSRNGASTEFSVHAGADGAGPVIGMATVTPVAESEGLYRWRFRGRGLQALASRKISLHSHTGGTHAALHGVPLTLR